MATVVAPEDDLLAAVSAAAHSAVDQIIASFRGVSSSRVLNPAPASALASIAALAPPDTAAHAVDDVTREAIEDVLAYRMTMNHPRTLCFIPAPVSPVSWLGDVLVAGHNAFAGSWYQSPGPSALEKELIAWLAAQVGFPSSTAGGLFVSGGSIANLTPLVAARDAHLHTPERRRRGRAYVAAQTHSSVAKALRILGLMDDQIATVRSDERFRLDIEDLRGQVEDDLRKGLVPFVVVASLGTTNTGSIDDLDAIADICEEYGLWMHVDGAYGASVVLSKRHKYLAKGLERADSLAWDAHKWLFQTYDTGIVLVKNKDALLRSFVNSAEYLRDAMATTDQPNFWNFGLELTRPARATKLWLTLRVFGMDNIGEMIDKGFRLAEVAQKRLEELPGWEIVSPAQMAIIVFRYAPPELEADVSDEISGMVSKQAIDSNTACVLTTRMNGRTVLRIVAIHPELEEHEMVSIVDRLNDIAVKIQFSRIESQ